MRSPHFRYLLQWAIGMQVFFAVLYLAGLALTPEGQRFGGFLYNPDDPYVYLSWMRQAFEGHILFRNLFTLEFQRGVSFHVLFLAMGSASALLHLPLIVIYHTGRFVFGVVFVFVLGGVIAEVEPLEDRQRWMLPLALLGSGLGWVYYLACSPMLDRMKNLDMPTDLWMTETIPFLSLMLSPLFACALCLLLGAFLCILRAERLGSVGWAVGSGACLLLLGNIHSYDILVFHPVWIVTLSAFTIRRGWTVHQWTRWRWPASWGRYLLAAFVGSPSVIYQWWVYQVEPVFHSRAGVPTLSPLPWFYLLGVGFGLLLAALLVRRGAMNAAATWAGLWCLLALLLPYAATPAGPISFQRKLAIGLNLPFLLLAGAYLSARLAGIDVPFRKLRAPIGGAVIVVGALSNACFCFSVLLMLARNQNNVFPMAPLYIPIPEERAMAWLHEHHRAGDVVLSMPWMGNIIPSESGDAVFVGHWGETADFGGKLTSADRFFAGKMSPGLVGDFLKSNGIRYVYRGTAEKVLARQNASNDACLSLKLVAHFDAVPGALVPVDIYAVP